MRLLVSFLGACELLMAVSAGPVATIVVGVICGVALMVAPWVPGRSRAGRLSLLLVGTVPFAVITWWSVVTPLLAVVALGIGLSSMRPTGHARRDAASRVAAPRVDRDHGS